MVWLYTDPLNYSNIPWLKHSMSRLISYFKNHLTKQLVFVLFSFTVRTNLLLWQPLSILKAIWLVKLNCTQITSYIVNKINGTFRWWLKKAVLFKGIYFQTLQTTVMINFQWNQVHSTYIVKALHLCVSLHVKVHIQIVLHVRHNAIYMVVQSSPGMVSSYLFGFKSPSTTTQMSSSSTHYFNSNITLSGFV